MEHNSNELFPFAQGLEVSRSCKETMAEGGFVDQSPVIFLSEHESLHIDRPSLYSTKGSIWPNFIVSIENGVTGGDSVWWVGGNIWRRLAAGLPQASCGRWCGLPPPVWLWWEWTVGSMWALWAPCTARLYTQAIYRMKAKGHGSNSLKVISRQLGTFAKSKAILQ